MDRGVTPPGAGPADSPAAAIEAFAGDPNFMASLARGLAVLRAFGGGAGGRSVAELTRATGIPRAAVRRCLYTLAQLGYVASEDGRSFRLRPAVLALGYAYVAGAPLAAIVQPVIDRVSRDTNESCSVAVLEGDEVVYLARATTARRIMSVDLGVGSRLPAWCTSLGRVLLAARPAPLVEDYLARIRLAALTPRTVTDPAALRHILAEVRRAGHAIVDQELELGLRSLAVPISDLGGRTVAAINIGTQAARLSVAELHDRLLPVLRQAAAEIGAALPPGTDPL